MTKNKVEEEKKVENVKVIEVEKVEKLFQRMVGAKTKQEREHISDQIVKNYLHVEVYTSFKVPNLSIDKKFTTTFSFNKKVFHRVSIEASTSVEAYHFDVWFKINSPEEKGKLIKLAEDVKKIKDRISTKENFQKTVEKVLPEIKKKISFDQKDIDESFIKYFLGSKIKVKHIDTSVAFYIRNSTIDVGPFKNVNIEHDVQFNVGTIFDIYTKNVFVFDKHEKEVRSREFPIHVELLLKPDGSVSTLKKHHNFHPLSHKLEDVDRILSYVFKLYNGFVDPDVIEDFLFKYLPKKFNFRIESADDMSYEAFSRAKHDSRIITIAKPGRSPQHFIVEGENLTHRQIEAISHAMKDFEAYRMKVSFLQRFPDDMCR